MFEAGYGWVSGLQDNILLMVVDNDDNFYKLLPGVGTGVAFWETLKNCGSAIADSF